MGNNVDERWLSRRELADRYRLPVKTLAQWASKGTGPRYARMGRHVRYRLSDVIDWETERVDKLDNGIQPGVPTRQALGKRTVAAPKTQTPIALGTSDDPHYL
jgi:predicted DNA-binding transcriptional regulator AlpA